MSAPVAMICGAIWRGDEPPAAMLDPVAATLEVYGDQHEWSGTIGPWSASVRSFGAASTIAVMQSGTVVCGDVFLHDRDELAAQLGAEQVNSDIELLGAAYERWAREMCEYVSGNYAIAIIDSRRHGLYLARDHSGSRYLAVHERHDAVAFASSGLALTGFPGVGHELDTERLAELAIAAYGTTRTFVKGVSSLAPGSWRWIDGQQRFTTRWWRPERLEIDDKGSIGAEAQSLRDEFERSVASTLRGAGRVGILLSGGLDSSSIAAVAARQLSPAPLNSYTSVPPPRWAGRVPRGWIADERDAVAALSVMTPNLNPKFVDLLMVSAFDHQRDLWELGGGPDRNPLNAAWEYACVQEAAADGVSVLLLGASGNHGFSADGPLWLAELARRFRLVALTREAVAWKRTTGKPLLATARGLVLWPLLPASVRENRQRRTEVDALSDWLSATAITPERLADLDVAEVLREVAEPHPGGWTRDLARLFMVPAAQVETEAAYRARFGVDLRDPTAGRRLNELAVRQPEWWRRHDGVTRAICRSAMADVLPPEILHRRTLGAQLPDWLDRMTDVREEIGVELEEMRDHPASRSVFEVDRLQAIFDAWPDRESMDDVRTIYDMRFALMRSVVLSRYARWFEERGRRVAAGGPVVVLSDPV